MIPLRAETKARGGRGPFAAAILMVLALAVLLASAAPQGRKARGKAPRKASPSGVTDEDEAKLESIYALPYVDFVEEETGEVKTGVTIAQEGRYQEGYTLFSNRGLCRADLIDRSGEVVNTWVRTPCHHWSDTSLLPDGRLMVIAMDDLSDGVTGDIDKHRALLELSWDGRLIGSIRTTLHHSFEVLPDGRILTLTVRPRRIPEFDPARDVRDEYVTILSPSGSVEEEVSLYEALTAGGPGFALKRKGSSLLKRQGAVDLIHSNAVQSMPFKTLEGRDAAHVPGGVLVTSRHQNALLVIDLRTGRIVWAWGQDELLGPHDGTWLENGHILVFDNGITRRWSRIVEVDPANGKIVWQYRAPNPAELYSRNNGAAQRLPNGNTLITDSIMGRGFEVTPDGEVVWKYVNPRRNREGRRSALIKMKHLDGGYVERARAAGSGSEAQGEPGNRGR